MEGESTGGIPPSKETRMVRAYVRHPRKPGESPLNDAAQQISIAAILEKARKDAGLGGPPMTPDDVEYEVKNT